MGTFERVLNRIGGADESEDYSIPKYLKAEQLGNMQEAVPALAQELQRYLEGASLHLAAARGEAGTPSKLEEHHAALDQLGRDSRSFASRLFLPDAPAAEQDLAVRPAVPGRRKVVLATSIADTSLTIDGVTVVIDSGMARSARFDSGSGMSRITTTRVSRAAADQRQGRAGRNAGHPGPSPRRSRVDGVYRRHV